MKKEKPDILKNELLDSAPGLLKVSKKNPFDVPANYFEELPQSVQHIKNMDAQKRHRSVFKYSTQRVLAYAAAVLVLFAMSISIVFLTQKDEINGFADIDYEYFESYFADLAEYDKSHYYDLLYSEGNDYFESAEGLFESAIWAEDEDLYFEYLMDYFEANQYSPDDLFNND